MTLHQRTWTDPPPSTNIFAGLVDDDDEEQRWVCPSETCQSTQFEFGQAENWSRTVYLECNGDDISRYEGDPDYNDTVDDSPDYFNCSDCGYEIWDGPLFNHLLERA